MDLMGNNRELLDTNIFFLSRSTLMKFVVNLELDFTIGHIIKQKFCFIIWPIVL